MNGSKRRLIWHGMFLFLIGLLTGFAETHFANVRMGLAAHLEGVMNGTFLVALGAVWNEVRLAARAKTIAYWTALYGTYVNWLVTMLAAVFGTGALSPITVWSNCATVAGEVGYGWIPHCGPVHHCCFAADTVGPAHEGRGNVRVVTVPQRALDQLLRG